LSLRVRKLLGGVKGVGKKVLLFVIVVQGYEWSVGNKIVVVKGGGWRKNYVARSELLSRGCELFSLSVDVTVFTICYLENCTKGSFTLGVRDPSVKSPNIMLVI
jgi:hypothetical protein